MGMLHHFYCNWWSWKLCLLIETVFSFFLLGEWPGWPPQWCWAEQTLFLQSYPGDQRRQAPLISMWTLESSCLGSDLCNLVLLSCLFFLADKMQVILVPCHHGASSLSCYILITSVLNLRQLVQHDGTCLKSQHTGGGGKRMVRSKPTWATYILSLFIKIKQNRLRMWLSYTVLEQPSWCPELEP